MDGRISIHRKIMDREWYTDINVKCLFIHCLLLSNTEDKNWRGVNIPRGSFITSVENLSNQLNLSQMQIRTALDKLINTKEIIKKTTNKYTMITVVRYSDYQDREGRNNKQITNKQQTNNKQITTTNNNNKIITKENNIYFDSFWNEYPKKKGKDKAMVAFMNACKSTDPEIIIEGAKRYFNECKKLGTEPTYIKRPQGRLNDKRWEDSTEDIEPDIENKNHYEWYKRNIVGNEFTDIDGTKLKYKDINYRRFLIYERGIERHKAQEIYEKAKGEWFDLSI